MEVGPYALDLFHMYQCASHEHNLELHPYVALEKGCSHLYTYFLICLF